MKDSKYDEQKLRQIVVNTALEWIGTPYVPDQMTKGAGVDCARLVMACLRSVDLISDEDIGIFGGDWWAHASEDTYFVRLLRHANRVAQAICSPSIQAKPGDVALCKAAGSRVFNHSGIVTHWPYVIEAIQPRVHEVDASTDPLWFYKEVVIMDPFSKKVSA